MAPSKKPYEMTSEERNKVVLLASYQCNYCKKWKSVHMFSKKEQKNWQNKKLMNPRIGGDASSGMRCSGCSGQQIHELKCEGHCGLVKCLDEFSKAQRTRGSRWCKECVTWKESNDPGLEVAPAPNNAPAPDEVLKSEEHNTASFWSPDGEDSDYDETFDIPYRQMSAMGIGSTASASNTADMSRSQVHQSQTAASIAPASISAAGSDYVPPHLRSSRPLSGGFGVGAPSLSGSSSGYVPPHLRGPSAPSRESDTASQSSVSNPYASSTISGPIPWNAVDRRRDVGVATSTQPNTPTAQAPPVVARARETDSGNWARPVGARRPAPPPRAPVPPRRVQQNDYDSDDSPDEI